MKHSKLVNDKNSEKRRLVSNPLLSEDAQRAVRLVEERGVSGCPYKKEIDAIVQWLAEATKDWFSSHPLDEKFQIDIPNNLSQKVDFLPIKINAIISYTDQLFTGGGRTRISFNENREIDSALIELNGYCNQYGGLIRRTILGTLYHEINHLYDAYYASLGRDKNRFYNSALRGQIMSDGSILHMITYRLFSETELNALVVSVFGDLEGMNSERQNFARDICMTQAYQVYYLILQEYRDAIDDLRYEESGVLLKQLLARGVKFKVPIHTLGDFKKALKQKTSFCLKKLIKNIGRAASLWYDKKEAEEANNITEFST